MILTAKAAVDALERKLAHTMPATQRAIESKNEINEMSIVNCHS